MQACGAVYVVASKCTEARFRVSSRTARRQVQASEGKSCSGGRGGGSGRVQCVVCPRAAKSVDDSSGSGNVHPSARRVQTTRHEPRRRLPHSLFREIDEKQTAAWNSPVPASEAGRYVTEGRHERFAFAIRCYSRGEVCARVRPFAREFRREWPERCLVQRSGERRATRCSARVCRVRTPSADATPRRTRPPAARGVARCRPSVACLCASRPVLHAPVGACCSLCHLSSAHAIITSHQAETTTIFTDDTIRATRYCRRHAVMK